jgi:hypothetical protein
MAEDACPVFPFDHARSVVQDLHAQLANLFGAFLRFDHGARRWLWTEARTGAAESTAAGVWVLTPDLYWDFQDDEYRQLVYNNVVTRRVPYRYLCADTLVNRDRISELQREYADVVGDAAAELAQFSVVPADEFVWCTEHVLGVIGRRRRRARPTRTGADRRSLHNCKRVARRPRARALSRR